MARVGQLLWAQSLLAPLPRARQRLSRGGWLILATAFLAVGCAGPADNSGGASAFHGGTPGLACAATDGEGCWTAAGNLYVTACLDGVWVLKASCLAGEFCAEQGVGAGRIANCQVVTAADTVDDSSSLTDAVAADTPAVAESPLTTCLAERCGSTLDNCKAQSGCVDTANCLAQCKDTDSECVLACEPVNGNTDGKWLVVCASQACVSKAAVCGNGRCEIAEKEGACPGDCIAATAFCGNLECTDGESPATCPLDCPTPYCGDGDCTGESGTNCPQDCNVVVKCALASCKPTWTACTADSECGAIQGCFATCSKPGGNCASCLEGASANAKVAYAAHQSCISTACGDKQVTCGDGICGNDQGKCSADCDSACGNGTCAVGEAGQCLFDCPASACGDGTCGAGEVGQCPEDCVPNGNTPVCGNMICDGDESKETCVADCPPPGCGDGVCSAEENLFSCPQDCLNGYTCKKNLCASELATCLGDAKCAAIQGVMTSNVIDKDIPCDVFDCKSCDMWCKIDPDNCDTYCAALNDKGANYAYEQLTSCYKAKCNGPWCGNGLCQEGEKASCSQDCAQPKCGNHSCEVGETAKSCAEDCDPKTCCAKLGWECGYDHGICGGDCGKCSSDKQCNDQENKCSPKPVCGNAVCEPGETYNTCLEDCPKCGDDICSTQETSKSCPSDCTAYCPNLTCDVDETAATCPLDCATGACGNGTCGAGETTANCPQDCNITWKCITTACKEPLLACGKYESCQKLQTCLSACADDSCKQGCANKHQYAIPTYNTLVSCQNSLCEFSGCGNGTCGGVENGISCPKDCDTLPVVCGNFSCQAGESSVGCPGDCPPPGCGDGTCALNESSTCPQDCNSLVKCSYTTCKSHWQGCAADADCVRLATCVQICGKYSNNPECVDYCKKLIPAASVSIFEGFQKCTLDNCDVP